MGRLLDAIADNLFWAFIAGVFLLWIGSEFVKGLVISMMRERTRRDIAAYIAEGSMSPEQGERLLKAGEAEEEEE